VKFPPLRLVLTQMEGVRITKKFLLELVPSTLTTDPLPDGATTVACPDKVLSPFGLDLVQTLRRLLADEQRKWLDEVEAGQSWCTDFNSHMNLLQRPFTRVVATHAVCPASEHSHLKIWQHLTKPLDGDKILLCRDSSESRRECFQTSVLKLYVPPDGDLVGFGITKSGSVYVLEEAPIDWETFKATFNFPPN
jgi:hypothetical protein